MTDGSDSSVSRVYRCNTCHRFYRSGMAAFDCCREERIDEREDTPE
jgi:hypothetical protein